MRKRWIASFALSLGFLATTAQAGDDLKGTASPTSAPAAAKIGRPVAVDDAAPPRLPPVIDNQVRPTAYDTTGQGVPSQATDPNIPRPLPVGTPTSSPNLHTWTKDDGSTAPPLASTGAFQSNHLGKPVAVDSDTLPAPREDSSSGFGATLWTRFTNAIGFGDDCDCGPDCAAGNCFGSCGADGCWNPGNRWYVTGEALVWWMKGQHVPALVTTGSTADAVPGALGQAHTQVLYGDRLLGTGVDGGGRVTAGYWFTRDHTLGLEGSFWMLGTKSNSFADSSMGTPPLFRPFVDETGSQNVELVAVPNPFTGGAGLGGTINVSSRTSLWGTEANFRSELWCCPNWHIDGLFGFRAMGLDDDLRINESLQFLSSPNASTPAGTSFLVNDRFRAINRFYGGQVGLDMECREGNWIFGFKPKVAVGSTSELVDISGGTTINVPGAGSTSYNGGLLAQQSNIGRSSRQAITVVPEANMSVGYQFNEHWRAFVGYNVIYWSNVVRAGEQIDVRVNRNQIPPAVGTGSNPALTFHSTDFWAQGVNFGIEFTW